MWHVIRSSTLLVVMRVVVHHVTTHPSYDEGVHDDDEGDDHDHDNEGDDHYHDHEDGDDDASSGSTY